MGIGGGIGYLTYNDTRNRESKKSFYPDGYLKKVLTIEHLKSNPQLFDNVLMERQKVKNWLANKFKGGLVTAPEDAMPPPLAKIPVVLFPLTVLLVSVTAPESV